MMLFSSTIYLFAFLPFVWIGYFLLKPFRRVSNVFLLIVSLLFYAFGEPIFVWLMITSIVVNYFLGLWSEKVEHGSKAGKWLMFWMLLYNIGILFVFKYLGPTMMFINTQGNYQLPIPDFLLPIGISFFTFQSISYVVDIYRKNAKAQHNILNVGLYISFFPQLIAGPIVRYNTIAWEIENRRENWNDFSTGMNRFVIGLAKKVLLSNTIAIVADRAFLQVNDGLSLVFAWVGAIAYGLQIYYDFSGYSDMAIGLGLMLGFHFDENFNFPYIAQSVSEFWRRWHISLGQWFRDYVYFPLGGSRVSNPDILIRNLFVVWLLTGIWHGAKETFIVWGLWFFIFILIEKLFPFMKWMRKKGRVWPRVYTLLVVLFGWVLFRSNSMTDAFSYFGSMLNPLKSHFLISQDLMYLKEYGLFLMAGLIFAVPLKPIKGMKWISPIAMWLLFMISVTYLVKGTYNPFIYFNF
ncbi:MBOAT family O-acyltransferase [Turicibacter sanguinis]|uniref:MBOAT family O-acyltransferase n=1 Tax=Turicibacter sanguinis TaxID=154288 RepID=UPI00294340CF|nr:MBOAT family O-acyltransferase [Turicibacter sanguinis]